jgi:hypothetical protein
MRRRKKGLRTALGLVTDSNLFGNFKGMFDARADGGAAPVISREPQAGYLIRWFTNGL